MKALSLIALALIVWCGLVPTVCAIDNSQGKWALHFAGRHNVKVNTCSFDIGGCQNIVTEGPPNLGGPCGDGHASYDVYIIACDVERIQSTRFGLYCDGSPGSCWGPQGAGPFWFYGWTNCSNFETPTPGWPWCDEGVQLSWVSGRDGPYVNLGILHIYVYSVGRLRTGPDPRVGYAEWVDDSPDTVRISADSTQAFGHVSFGTGATISGIKFNDANGNGIKDAWESGLSGWMISLDPGGLATLTDENGEFSFSGLDSNTYTVTEVVKRNWVRTCPPPPGNYVIDLNPWQSARDIDFGNRTFGDYQDLSVSIGGGRARPGFQKSYGINYQNKGTVAVDATVTLDLPSAVSHLESSPGGTYSPGQHKVAWNVGTLAPGFIGWLWTRVEIPVTVPRGTVLTSTAEIKPSGGDISPGNNIDSESQLVTGSYDPNDKLVTPEGLITGTDTLRYQIRFQNVGTDTAFTVVVKDTLDTNLDITTLQTGASLHPYTFAIAGRELSWKFTNIQLPDSNVNEPGSHGFVTFKVQPMPDLPVGTEIENCAGVYFDFNPPVITNTVLNTIIEALPATVDVDPNTLNLKSEGKYATTYIELPEGCDPWDIDVSTVLFNGVLPAAAVPTAVADYDSDGVADRMVKFNRSGVIGLLSGSEGSRWWLEERGGEAAPLRHGEEFEVTVSGELEDGTPFLGTDVIRVINPGGDSDDAVVLEVYPSPLDKIATISFGLPEKGPVKLCIYDAAGRLVRRLLEGQRAAGRHEVTWDRRTDAGRQVSAGVYFVRLERQGGAIVEKVLVVK